MPLAADTFASLALEILRRYARQNRRAIPPDDELLPAAINLWRGFTGHTQPGPRETSPTETAALDSLLATLLDGTSLEPHWLEPLRQLAKACFYPELSACRESYREVDRAGRCRRQEIGKATARVSGAHCVDCPHWNLDRTAHVALLESAWHPSCETTFRGAPDVFLPEDFRRFRNLVRAGAA